MTEEELQAVLELCIKKMDETTELISQIIEHLETKITTELTTTHESTKPIRWVSIKKYNGLNDINTRIRYLR